MQSTNLKDLKRHFESPKSLAIFTAISCLIGGVLGYLAYIYSWI